MGDTQYDANSNQYSTLGSLICTQTVTGGPLTGTDQLYISQSIEVGDHDPSVGTNPAPLDYVDIKTSEFAIFDSTGRIQGALESVSSGGYLAGVNGTLFMPGLSRTARTAKRNRKMLRWRFVLRRSSVARTSTTHPMIWTLRTRFS